MTSEYFFDAPEVLRKCNPGAYAELSAFYRQDPLDRVGAELRR